MCNLRYFIKNLSDLKVQRRDFKNAMGEYEVVPRQLHAFEEVKKRLVCGERVPEPLINAKVNMSVLITIQFYAIR